MLLLMDIGAGRILHAVNLALFLLAQFAVLERALFGLGNARLIALQPGRFGGAELARLQAWLRCASAG
ncbi:hypothetical protein LP419_09445 [Massilia sp. H-1]|nr:hypothetical protein LP419_09445 [Massilia sp. H-1]